MEKNKQVLIKEVSQKLVESGDYLYKNMPQKDEIRNIIKNIRSVLFPEYFECPCAATCVEEKLDEIYTSLKEQVLAALIFTDKTLSKEDAEQKAENVCAGFLSELPSLRNALEKDVEAGYCGDPAAKSREDIIISYPGMLAVFVYRIAHILYVKNVPLIPRIMTEYAHSRTGIDINAGAEIGEYFFIDHGTGVVIGETTVIGDRVKLYQGVTLGALSTRKGQELAGIKRHPTIESNVTIYSNSTVLGGDTVIGEGCIIGGSAFITSSVPPHTKVIVKNQELIFKSKKSDIWEI